MKLLEISMNNFRQFYGSQSLILSSLPEKNVTLIHAENGFGKTTILNSVIWTFFGDTTDNFERPEDLINHAARDEGIKKTSVSVKFEHDDSIYIATRTFECTRNTHEFQIDTIAKTGEIPMRAPETFINKVMPREMARYFLFDGEHAAKFSQEDNQAEVATAIRSILGCNLAETIIDDLKFLAASFGKEIGNLPDQSKLKEIEKRLVDVATIEEKRTSDAKRLKDNFEVMEKQIGAIDLSLRNSEAASETQKYLDKVRAELKSVENELRSVNTSIVRWVSSRAIPLASTKLSSQTLGFIQEAELKGRIPSPYGEEFVKSLLAARKCICGSSLEAGSESWGHVADLLKDATKAVTLGRVMRARSKIAVLKEARRTANEELKGLNNRKARLLERQQKLQIDEHEYAEKLKGVNISEISAQQKAREELVAKLNLVRRQIFDAEKESEQAKSSRAAMEAELEREAKKHAVSRPLQERRTLALRAAELLKVQLATYETLAKESITQSVNQILENVAHKDYKLKIGADYSLKLLRSNKAITSAKSTGENQLLSLAFTAALVQFSEKRASRKNNELLVPGVVAPLILDSPFGSLDESYQKESAMFLHTMAHQIVVMVSSSQVREVGPAVVSRVGAEYILISENYAPQGNKSIKYTQIGNRKIALNEYDCDRDMTRIERVR